MREGPPNALTRGRIPQPVRHATAPDDVRSDRRARTPTSHASSTRWTGSGGTAVGHVPGSSRRIRSSVEDEDPSTVGEEGRPFRVEIVHARDRRATTRAAAASQIRQLSSRPGQDEPAIGGELDPGVPQGHHGGPVEARGGAVPDPHPIDRPSRRGAGDDRPARTWHGGTPRLPAAAQADGRRPRPTASCDALGGRREVPAVRGERQPLDRGGSSVHRPGREDRPDEPAGRRVPDPDLAVGAPGGGEPAVGRERVAGHAGGVVQGRPRAASP